VTDGINDSILDSLVRQIEKEKANFEIIALTIGTTSLQPDVKL
jgi:hypothetical protein